MLSPCIVSREAAPALCDLLGFSASPGSAVDVEFKEVPYFLVARSRAAWMPEQQGDINAISIVGVTDRGLVVDPMNALAAESELTGTMRTLIPWSNIVSLTITRADSGAKGT